MKETSLRECSVFGQGEPLRSLRDDHGIKQIWIGKTFTLMLNPKVTQHTVRAGC